MVSVVGRFVITGRWSRGSSTGCGPGSRGVICPTCSGRIRRSPSAIGGSVRTAPGDRIHARLVAEADAAGELEWQVSVDSTITRALQHSTNLGRVERPAGL